MHVGLFFLNSHPLSWSFLLVSHLAYLLLSTSREIGLRSRESAVQGLPRGQGFYVLAPTPGPGHGFHNSEPAPSRRICARWQGVWGQEEGIEPGPKTSQKKTEHSPRISFLQQAELDLEKN